MRKKQLNFRFGEIELNIYPKVCCIQTADGQWKLQFGNRTREYAQIALLAGNQSGKELEALALLMFYTRLVVVDTKFLGMYQGILKEFFELTKAPEVSKEEDDKILEEERKLYEERHDK